MGMGRCADMDRAMRSRACMDRMVQYQGRGYLDLFLIGLLA